MSEMETNSDADLVDDSVPMWFSVYIVIHVIIYEFGRSNLSDKDATELSALQRGVYFQKRVSKGIIVQNN